MSPPANILETIAARVRDRIAEGRYAARAPTLPAPDGARFTACLREPGTRIIAEIKKRSPSTGEILPNADRRVETLSLAYRRGHAAALSIVTESDFFGGSPDWIPRARRMSGLPALMKDFILEEPQLDFAVSLGADAVLLILSLLPGPAFARLLAQAQSRGLAVLAESHDSAEVARAVEAGAEIVGINARDLRSFEVHHDELPRLAAQLPASVVGVAESGIRTRRDVETLAAAGFRAFLVGETLLRSEEPETVLRELRGDR